MLPALRLVLERERHVVAQIVKTEFVVGAVGDVGGVGGALFLLRLTRDHHPHAHAQKIVEPPHPLGVTTGQVVVDGDHVHALAGQGIQIDRQGGHKGLALAGFHFGDLALVQHRAADDLYIEVAHAQHTARRLANGGEGLGLNLVHGCALCQPGPKPCA